MDKKKALLYCELRELIKKNNKMYSNITNSRSINKVKSIDSKKFMSNSISNDKEYKKLKKKDNDNSNYKISFSNCKSPKKKLIKNKKKELNNENNNNLDISNELNDITMNFSNKYKHSNCTDYKQNLGYKNNVKMLDNLAFK